MRQKVSTGQGGLSPHRNVFLDGHRPKELYTLKRSPKTGLGSAGRRPMRELTAVEPHFAVGDRNDSSAGIEHRRFPGAVGTDQPCDRTGGGSQ
jgi:hypothetical protein